LIAANDKEIKRYWSSLLVGLRYIGIYLTYNSFCQTARAQVSVTDYACPARSTAFYINQCLVQRNWYQILMIHWPFLLVPVGWYYTTGYQKRTSRKWYQKLVSVSSYLC